MLLSLDRISSSIDIVCNILTRVTDPVRLQVQFGSEAVKYTG